MISARTVRLSFCFSRSVRLVFRDAIFHVIRRWIRMHGERAEKRMRTVCCSLFVVRRTSDCIIMMDPCCVSRTFPISGRNTHPISSHIWNVSMGNKGERRRRRRGKIISEFHLRSHAFIALMFHRNSSWRAFLARLPRMLLLFLRLNIAVKSIASDVGCGSGKESRRFIHSSNRLVRATRNGGARCPENSASRSTVLHIWPQNAVNIIFQMFRETGRALCVASPTAICISRPKQTHTVARTDARNPVEQSHSISSALSLDFARPDENHTNDIEQH